MNMSSDALSTHNPVSIYTTTLVTAISIMIMIAIIAPRALGTIPPALSLIGLLAYRPIFGEWPKFSKYALFWTISISALAFISSLWAIDPDFVIKRSIKITGILISGAILFSLTRDLPGQALKKIQNILPICFIAAGTILMIDLYSDGLIYKSLHKIPEEQSFNLSFINRSVITYTLGLFIVLPLIHFSEFCKQRKIILTILLLIPTLAIIYQTHSQSAHLALLIGTIIFFCFPYNRKTAWYALSLLLFLALVTTPFLAQFLFKYATDTLIGYSWFQNGYAADRLEIWDFISRYAINSPIYGFGVEATRAVEAFDTKQLYHKDVTVLHPHNFSLQIWIEYGCIGIAFTILFFGHILSQIQKMALKPARITLPLLFAIISASSTGYGLWQSWWLGLFMVLLTLASLATQSISVNEQNHK